MEEPGSQYLHISYIPESGWILTIMSRLLNSENSRMREAFEKWSDTRLEELGVAITTRMEMLARCIWRLNGHVAELRHELISESSQLEGCLSGGYAFSLKDRKLSYELLLDMASFIFETRSLYEIMVVFLRNLFSVLFERKITEADVQSVLAGNNVDTRWIEELRKNRILFFHRTAPWLAVEIRETSFDPVLLKKNVITLDNPADFVSFSSLRAIYDGFVNSSTVLHRFVIEQVRLFESAASS
jgi:hypothetical protein